MRHILIGSPDKEAVALITKGLSSEFVIVVAADTEDFFHKFREKLFELSFIDITYLDQLRAQQSLSDYKKTLNLFWEIFPTANIIILSAQEQVQFFNRGRFE